MTDNAGKKNCEVCNKTFQSDRELQEHRQTQHSRDQDKDKPEKRPMSDQSQEGKERHQPKREEHVA
jgi:hypothetical protein